MYGPRMYRRQQHPSGDGDPRTHVLPPAADWLASRPVPETGPLRAPLSSLVSLQSSSIRRPLLCPPPCLYTSGVPHLALPFAVSSSIHPSLYAHRLRRLCLCHFGRALPCYKHATALTLISDHAAAGPRFIIAAVLCLACPSFLPLARNTARAPMIHNRFGRVITNIS